MLPHGVRIGALQQLVQHLLFEPKHWLVESSRSRARSRGERVRADPERVEDPAGVLEWSWDQGMVDWDVPLDAGFQAQREVTEHLWYQCDACLSDAV